jgi:hypothetical protein
VDGGSPVRARARRVAKSLIAAAQLLDPSRLVLLGHRSGASVALVAVYRARHAARLQRLLAALDQRATVRLWALDEISDRLRSLTVGHGPGIRFALLNRLIDTIPEGDRRDGLVLSDDDYSFRIGDLGQLVAVGQALDLDLWQPAHIRDSWANFPFVRRRPGVVLRRTSFVEQGPVLVLSARAQGALLPLPEDLGMGWGVELRWRQLCAQHELGVGIVDALAIHHLPPSVGYDRDFQAEQLRLMLEAAGFSSVQDLQQEHSRVRLREGWRLLRK